MALPDRDAEHLNLALDGVDRHSHYDTTGPVDDLLGAFHRLQAMNAQTTVDATLKSDVWRTMMNSVPASPRVLAAPTPPLDRIRSLIAPLRYAPVSWTRRKPLPQAALAIALLLAIVIGAVGFQQYRPGGEGSPSIPAPMAALSPYQGPDIAKCEAQSRPAGAVENLATEQATTPAYFPRFGPDPDNPLGPPDRTESTVPGETFLNQTQPVTSLDPAIYTLLEQLKDCSPYYLSNGYDINIDGRYFALFSDDFFRREFEGYLEAGVEIELHQVWIPIGVVPAILEARSIGDRIALVLDRPYYKLPGGAYSTLVLARDGNNWRVDEVGYVGATSLLNPVASPVAPAASPIVGLHYSGPLEVAYVLFDQAMAGAPPSASSVTTICDAVPGGEDIPCGWNYNRVGPWTYNEYPASTDFTFSLSNVSDTALRFEVRALNISVMVDPHETTSFEINALPGDYLFEIFEGETLDPLSGGVLTFNSPTDPYSMG